MYINDFSAVSNAYIEVVRLEGLPEYATLIRCCVNKVASNRIRTKEAASEGYYARGEHDATSKDYHSTNQNCIRVPTSNGSRQKLRITFYFDIVIL